MYATVLNGLCVVLLARGGTFLGSEAHGRRAPRTDRDVLLSSVPRCEVCCARVCVLSPALPSVAGRMSASLLEAVRALRVADPDLGQKPLLAKLREEQPELGAAIRAIRAAHVPLLARWLVLALLSFRPSGCTGQAK